jgi:hypothetical protein
MFSDKTAATACAAFIQYNQTTNQVEPTNRPTNQAMLPLPETKHAPLIHPKPQRMSTHLANRRPTHRASPPAREVYAQTLKFKNFMSVLSLAFQRA